MLPGVVERGDGWVRTMKSYGGTTMLEQFKIPAEDEVRVPPEVMRATVEDVFRALGLSDPHARQSADVLLYADLRGCDTHGVSNMLRIYVDWFRDGTIDPNGRWRITRDATAACTIDSGGVHGGVVGPEGMRIAIERARDHGVGAVNVYNGGHFGAAAYTAAMALEHDMIGVSMCSGGMEMTPTFGAERLVGLNPIAVAAPSRDEPPFVFDASMSAVAGNKVRIADRLGRGALPAWIAGPDGAPIMEERPIPEGFMHLPLGGTREIGSHKGFGLAMMVEVLASMLCGGAAGQARRARQCHHFLADRVDAFTDLEQFKGDMDDYLLRLRTAKTAPGAERVRYPGLNAHETEIERRANGIPYHREVIGWFAGILPELGIENRLPAI
jgi:LDH2 family malate/lactate/ureidoglycolate dehydrogenase